MTPISSSINRECGKYIPWIIVAFFASFIALLSGFVWIAFSNRPSEVTADAYQKGLSYNQTLKKALLQNELGWKSEIMIRGETVRFVLRNAQGMPISGAEVQGWLVRPSEKRLDTRFTLRSQAEGVYEAQVDWPAGGLWDVRITARYEGHEYQAAKTLTRR